MDPSATLSLLVGDFWNLLTFVKTDIVENTVFCNILALCISTTDWLKLTLRVT